MTDRYLSVGCFGKLPFWREYLEGGARSPASRELREWLRQGRESLVLENSTDNQQVTDAAFEAHLRVLLSSPNSKDLLVGVVRPSRDAGGRHAPFSVFAQLPRRLYGRHYALLPSALGPVWDALDDAWAALHEVPSREALEETYEALEIPAPVDVKLARGGYQGRQLDDAGALINRAALETLRGNMPEIFERIRKGSGSNVCVAFPAAEELSEACFNASLWIDLVNRHFRLRRFDPSVLFDARPGLAGRQLYLKFGALDPADYVQMLGDPAAVGTGEVLRPVESAQAEAGDPLDATYGQLLETVF